MSYQVLARKWRPRNFEQLVGQEHVSRALINGLDNDRLHHAFLFTGTRGVGKTTIARILSKSLNCDAGVTSKPCGECSACNEIDEGRFVDLIEVDAASRTKVEDTRELLENVQYAPTRGRYKVYLIDEVHMLSNHSFNALLKTLEEPPPHVKFLLATTDPQKLPVTILSRCLQFNLKKLPAQDITDYLAQLLDKEKITFDRSALKLLARSAEGSMRDALSLLDQAIAYGGGKVGDQDVRDMLGTIEATHVYELIEKMHAQDAAAVMQTIAQLDERSPDYLDVMADIISVLHHIAMEQQVPGSMTADWDDPEKIGALAAAITAQDIQLYYQIALQGREDMKMNPLAREGFEMSLLRMIAFRPWKSDTHVTSDASETKSSTDNQVAAPKQPASPAQAVKPAEAATDVSSAAEVEASPVTPMIAEPARQFDESPVRAAAVVDGLPDWQEIFESLNLKAMAQQLAANCQLEAIEDDMVRLILDQAHAGLLIDGAMQKIELALNDYFGKSVKLKIQPGIVPAETPAQKLARQNEERQKQAVDSIEQDEKIHMMKEMFGATVPTDAIQPVDEQVD